MDSRHATFLLRAGAAGLCQRRRGRRKVAMNIWVTIGCSLLSGILGSVLIVVWSYLTEKRISRNVAYAVVFSLQQEMTLGLQVIEETKVGKREYVGELPTKGWESLQSLLADRNVLDAIIRYGNAGKVADSRIGTTFGDKRFETYKVEEVLSHLKNYFSYIVPNFRNKTRSSFTNPTNMAELYVGATNVNLTLKKILNGLHS